MHRKIAAKVAGWGASRQLRSFLAATGSPQRVQQQMLERQLRLLAGSAFARDHGLSGSISYHDFARQVPIRRYEQFAPYIEPLKEGRFDSLFAPSEELLMFALTSGTTGRAKFIPVTARFVDDYRRGWNIFGVKALLDHPRAFFRKIVQMTSSAREESTPCGLWAGAITGLQAQTQKWIVRKHYVTPLAVAEVKDPVAKCYTVARLAVTEDVSFTSTANPSTILRLAQTMAEHSEQLIRDVHDGTLRPPGRLPEGLVADLGRRLRPRPRCARRLEALARRAGRLLPKDVWRLEYLMNWTGGTLKLYLSRFGEYFGETPVRDIGLLASEGRFSIPVEDHTPAGILEITSNFFEFIPEAEYGGENPTVLTLEELEVGQRYFVVFSNASGLTRYDLGDCVEVVGLYQRTPMIAFLNKGSHISSLTGEKVSEHQAVEAMARLSAKLGRRIENFLLGPQWSDPPYYALTVEQSDANPQLAHSYDRILAELNIEYAAKRESLRLGPVELRTVPDGHFANEDLARQAQLGRTEQYKRKFLLTITEPDQRSTSV
ncbi:MAG: GH3 auxin-responsive promoter family protein [Phycisphaerae bacterium]|nr:GH3 auxin-responsive promoter family protein [Phycisphaerae bacterium]